MELTQSAVLLKVLRTKGAIRFEIPLIVERAELGSTLDRYQEASSLEKDNILDAIDYCPVATLHASLWSCRGSGAKISLQ